MCRVLIVRSNLAAFTRNKRVPVCVPARQAKVGFLQMELDEANAEVVDYQRKQADFQSGMKQAFMRGVSVRDFLAHFPPFWLC